MEVSLSNQTKREMRSKAEELIHQAASEQLITLNLQGLMLAELPEMISTLTQLSTLNISNNDLDVLPDWISNLTQLSELDISKNNLCVLPDWIGN